MRTQKFFVMLSMLIIILAFILPAGCAKTAAVKEEPQATAQATELEKEKAREKAMEEQLAQEKAKEQAMAKEEAKEKAAKKAEVKEEASQFDDIHFAFDRSDLRPDAREILDMHAKWLKEHPKYGVRIEGNCDERGTVEYNLALGNRRANSAMKYLVDLGVDKKRISTISYGKERPLDPGHDEEAWAKNRRDHFVVTEKK